MSPDANKPNVILGDFELHEIVGRGGMGTVYRAWQRSLQRVVALKVLAAHIGDSPKSIQRFQREAQAAAKLHHTHIVPIFAQGEEKGTYYYAMEFVEGRSLNAMISDERDRRFGPVVAADLADTVPLPASSPAKVGEKPAHATTPAPATASSRFTFPSPGVNSEVIYASIARSLAGVADALDYAHRQGIVHRDIKPHNLVFGADGRLRITDFGLARIAEQPGVTLTGEVVGSPLYMSPEQLSDGGRTADHRTDIFSLGVTMFEWLTLRPPHPGETREAVISHILTSEAPLPRVLEPDIPIDLETICIKAMERDPGRRYQSAGDMRDDLLRFSEKRAIRARRAGVVERSRRLVRRHPVTAVMISAGIVVAGLAWSLQYQRSLVGKQAAANARIREDAAHLQQSAERLQQHAEATQKQNELLLHLLQTVPIPGAANAALPVIEAIASSTEEAMAKNEKKPATVGAQPEAVLSAHGIARRAAVDLFTSVAERVPMPASGGGADEDLRASALQMAIDLRNRDPAGALKILNIYLLGHREDAHTRQLRVSIHGQLGDYASMLTEAAILLEQDESTGLGHLWRALARLLLNDIEPAMIDVQRAAGEEYFADWVSAVRGLALLQSKKSMDSIQAFDDALAKAPGLTVAWCGRAAARHAAGQLAAAVDDLSHVLESDPDNADVLAARGDILLASGEFDGAIADFNRAIVLAGDTAAIRARLMSATFRKHLLESPPEPASPAKPQDPKPVSTPDEVSLDRTSRWDRLIESLKETEMRRSIKGGNEGCVLLRSGMGR